MKQPNSLLKIAAVLSSVLLAGGYVAYRAGAFNWIRAASARPAAPDSSPTAETNPDMFYSSKSMPIFIDPAKSQQPADPKQSAATIMGGSKSDRIEILPLNPSTTQSPPTIMGGSKSAGIFVPASPTTTKGTQPPASSPPPNPAP